MRRPSAMILLILPGLLSSPENVLSMVSLRIVIIGSLAFFSVGEVFCRNTTSSATQPGKGKYVL